MATNALDPASPITATTTNNGLNKIEHMSTQILAGMLSTQDAFTLTAEDLVILEVFAVSRANGLIDALNSGT